MKRLLLGLILILLVGCNSVQYRSITRPNVEKPSNEYFMLIKIKNMRETLL